MTVNGEYSRLDALIAAAIVYAVAHTGNRPVVPATERPSRVGARIGDDFARPTWWQILQGSGTSWGAITSR